MAAQIVDPSQSRTKRSFLHPPPPLPAPPLRLGNGFLFVHHLTDREISSLVEIVLTQPNLQGFARPRPSNCCSLVQLPSLTLPDLAAPTLNLGPSTIQRHPPHVR